MSLSLLDVVSRYVTPQKSTQKQWSSPCPLPSCGGTDRLCIFPYASIHHGEEVPPHVWCRQCGYWGTAEMLLRDKEKISLADARAIIAGSKDLSEATPWTQRYSGKAVKTTPADIDGAPCQEWQWSGKAFCKVAKAILWSPAGEKALTWLHNRGLSDETIQRHNIGYNPTDRQIMHPQEWGLSEKFSLPRGIILPYLGQDQLWKIEIRLPVEGKGKQRYHTIKGSTNALYGYEPLVYQSKAIICEGVFDALVMEQVLAETGIGDVVTVATGSADSAQEHRWLMRLAICSRVIVAFDNDEAGHKASRFWLDRLSNAERWAPPVGDINESYLVDKNGLIGQTRELLGLKQGSSLENSLHCAACHICLAPSVVTDIYGLKWCDEHAPKGVGHNDQIDFDALEEYCIECGDEIDTYDNYGRAWCTLHMPRQAMPVIESKPIIDPVYEACQQIAHAISEETTKHTAPIPMRRGVKPKSKPKKANQCRTDQCEGVECRKDMLGNLWCINCKLRRELVDGMASLGFPRLEYSPTHFIEPGEDAVATFAKSMSMTAILLSCKEIARIAEEVEEGRREAV